MIRQVLTQLHPRRLAIAESNSLEETEWSLMFVSTAETKGRPRRNGQITLYKRKNMMKLRDWLRTWTFGERRHTNLLIDTEDGTWWWKLDAAQYIIKVSKIDRVDRRRTTNKKLKIESQAARTVFKQDAVISRMEMHDRDTWRPKRSQAGDAGAEQANEIPNSIIKSSHI